MTAYLDSSVLLRHILLGEEPIRHALAFPRVVSSELIEIECRRVLHRCRLAGELTDESLAVARERLDEVLAGIDLLEMSRRSSGGRWTRSPSTFGPWTRCTSRPRCWSAKTPRGGPVLAR